MSQRSAARAYTRELGLAMAAYVIVVLVSIKLVGGLDQPIKTLVAIAPLVPAALALFAYLRFLSRMDELGRRIQLEALAFGFGAAGMLTFAYGFLENAGFRQLSYIWVFPLMIFLWGVGGAIASYRYR
jgi:ABC-type cobalamin transport system permease subunit